METLKAAAAAAQAKISVDLAESQEAAQASVGLPARQRGVGVAAQVALARRESPHRGGRLLGLARALVREMPHTLAALETGRLNEWRATLLVKETACLSRADRTQVDAEVWSDPERVATMGDRGLAQFARSVGYRLDPHAVVNRSARAAAERHVTLRPAPDTMTYLTALLPVAEGVAAYAALTRAADGARATGDPRGRGQVMADTLVERVTGRAVTEPVPVRVSLTMSDSALFAGGNDPAHVTGFGPVPAGVARRLVADAAGSGAAWVRRLYARHGRLIAMESGSRKFPRGLAEFIDVRDQVCRTPWCDAPVRHHDHIRPHQAGGATSAENGQGLCEACNHAKQAPRWRASPDRDGTVVITTPTGATYRSRAPDLPGVPAAPPRAELMWGFPLDYAA